MLRIATWISSLIFLVLPIAAAQEFNRLEVGINGAGVFSKTSTSYNGAVTQKPTNSVAIFGSVRFRFSPKHGIEGNIGHTMNSQIFVRPPDAYRVQTGVTEYTLAYVFTPFNTARLEPFLLGGAGPLKFNPDTTYIDGFQSSFGAVSRTQLAFLYGGGADYRLWRRLALRLQYRGLIYKPPDFGVGTLFTGARGHMAEPSVGIVAKF
jgi:opacity protein-like surface antigen